MPTVSSTSASLEESRPLPATLLPAYTTLIAALAAAIGLALAAYLIIVVDRESDIIAAERGMENSSIMLAEQIRQAMMAGNLILDAAVSDVRHVGAQTPDEFRERLSTKATYDRLAQRMQGLPQIDVTTIVDIAGNVVNFSRDYPPPPINLADRDYFIAHTQGNVDGLFVSVPVKNRGNGEWTFYFSRGIRNDRGQLIGLILTGLKPAFFEDFFNRSGAGNQTAMALFRNDGILLARYPHSEKAMGTSFVSAPSFRVLRERPEGGVMRTAEARLADLSNKMYRLVSPRPVPDLPLVVNISTGLDGVLANWQWLAHWVAAAMAAAVVLVLTLGLIAFFLLRSREKVLAALVRSKQEAEHLAQAKSRFLSAMTHEIRTPMNAVMGMAGMLVESPLTPAQRDQARLIRDSGDLLLRILDDILDLNRLDAGKVEIENLTFDPCAITRDTIDLLAAQSKAKGLAVSADIGEIPLRVVGDSTRIRQVLFNLVGNAIKFTETGSVRVAAVPIADFGGQPGIEWTVSDTGVGIAPGSITQLFNEFVQADSSISRRFGGSGLGLVISKRLIDLMGGKIEVQSTLGRGTTIRFSVPLPAAAEEAEELASHDAPETELDAFLGRRAKPLRILVAEDNVTNQLVLRSMLTRPGLQIEIASNGIDVLAAAERQSFDLVLMDVQMPVLDGLAATRRLRERGGAWQTIPIIAFTANAFAEDRSACAAAGMNDFVAKPVRKEALLRTILRNMTGAGQAEERSGDVADNASGVVDVDASAIKALLEDLGQDDGAHILRTFIDSTESRLAELQKILSDRDRCLVEVHAIKGSARLAGASNLGDHAAALEARLCQRQDLAPADVTALTDLLARFKASPLVRDVLSQASDMEAA